MEEDDLPEAMSPITLPHAVDTKGMSDNLHIEAGSAAVKADVKAGQKRKQQDSNTNQLPRLDIMHICLCFAGEVCGPVQSMLTCRRSSLWRY